MPNKKAPSRETELLTHHKLFKLKFCWYVNNSPVNCIVPMFIVPKIIADNRTVIDVRCVWDCKVNGHNATLWVPGFMLPTASDAEDQVLKWLSTTVREYLEAGSPVEDYTQKVVSFTKSTQGDIDIG